MKKLITSMSLLTLSAGMLAAGVQQVNGGLKLTFDNAGGTVTIKRATGKFSAFAEIGTSTGTSYTDKMVGDNPYTYYYQIVKDGAAQDTLSLETELFGDNVYFYHPSDDQVAVAAEINAIHDAMMYDQFSENRYAFYFHPGSYLETGDIKIAYYMSIAGLGALPYDVKMFYLVTPPPLADNNATCTFWRSAENFEVVATNDAVMAWGVSQAAPMRRVVMNRPCEFDYWSGWASGGFAADCYFAQDAGSYSQQQFYARNCYMQNGMGRFAGGWNYAMQGIEFGAGTDMAANSDNWTADNNTRGWGNVSREEVTPVIREKPFLYFDSESNRYKVFRPALRNDSKGISYSASNMGAGTSYDLLNDFYIAKPGVSAATLNAQLQAGKHLFFTPGQYVLESPLYVNKANTILLGTGYATLIPGSANSTAAVVVGDVDGVTVASLLFDTFYSSENLLRVGPSVSATDHSANPTLLADLFFRVGGFKSWNVNVDVALQVNSDDVIGDHFWIWRADHGSGVGWFNNTSKNGIVVNGDDVTIYGLFNEHFQEYQALWAGDNGRLYFYQCETPYDVQNQSDYMSHDGTVDGYASYKVDNRVNNHYASMLGIYDVFIYTNGAEIGVANSIEVPKKTGVHVHHACNVCISNVTAGFYNIINDTVPSTWNTSQISGRYHIVDYQYTHDEDYTGAPAALAGAVELRVYPNPVVSCLNVEVPGGATGRVDLYSVSGRKVLSASTEAPVYVGNLVRGVYVATVTVGGESRDFKVIKQ